MTSLGWQPRLQRLQRLGGPLPPAVEMLVHAGDESGKLRVFVDTGLDGSLLDGQVEIAGAVGFEQARFSACGQTSQ